jgi:hypothetical protein
MNTLEEPSTLRAQPISGAERAVVTATASRALKAYRPLDWRVVTLSLATFFALSYTLCVYQRVLQLLAHSLHRAPIQWPA